MENMTGKWCYSTDEECYTGASDTEAEAHSAAQSAIDDESGWLGGGIVKDYWIAQCAHPLATAGRVVMLKHARTGLGTATRTTSAFQKNFN
jgi:hypothetical protein